MKTELSEENRSALGRLPELLLPWFAENARSMPWRETPQPYYTWISEIMLQQTRVDAATDYFLRFVRELPAIADLAAVPDEKLMKLWEGLGYYSRAKNLKKAAEILVAEHDGRLPADYAALLRLPGIGSYTAGAIASIAFELPYPAVDGNVLRVVSRVTACAADISDTAVKKDWEQEIASILPEKQIGDFNQSLMELGALICVPNGAPHCERCPLASVCKGRQENRAEDFPVKAPKKERRIEKKTVFLLTCGGKVALRKRNEQGLLAGMWEFPNAEGHLSAEEAETLLRGQGLNAVVTKTAPAKHIFTHVEWQMTGYRAELAAPPDDPELSWFSLRELEDEISLPSAFKKYRQILETML